jgi:hypothetical protein
MTKVGIRDTVTFLHKRSHCGLKTAFIVTLFMATGACSMARPHVSGNDDIQPASSTKQSDPGTLEAGVARAMREANINRVFAWTGRSAVGISGDGTLHMFTFHKSGSGYVLTPNWQLPRKAAAFDRTLSSDEFQFSEVLTDREAVFRVDRIGLDSSVVHIFSCWYARQREETSHSEGLLSVRVHFVLVKDSHIIGHQLIDLDPESPMEVEAKDFDGDGIAEFAIVTNYVSDTLRVWRVTEGQLLHPLVFMQDNSSDRYNLLNNETISIESDENGLHISSLSRDYRGILTTVYRWDHHLRAFAASKEKKKPF